MKREDFIKNVRQAVEEYIYGMGIVDANPQLRINPATLQVILVNGSDFLSEIADNDEAIEDAAYAHGDEDEDASDFQVARNPDFYSVAKMVVKTDGGKMQPDDKAINELADIYFK